MSPLIVIDKIHRAGGSIWSEAGDLRIEAPAGLLTPEDKSVLAEFKADLVPLLVRRTPVEDREEREAIVWSETAPPEVVSEALDQALIEFDRIVENDRPVVIRAEIFEDGFLLDCPTPETAAAIEAVRPQLEQEIDEILAGDNTDSDDAGRRDWWEAISDEDRDRLLSRRRTPDPCAWCGGRLRHNSRCVALDWEPRLPFGKFRGRRVSEVPDRYLQWFLDRSRRLDPSLRREIEQAAYAAGRSPSTMVVRHRDENRQIRRTG
jgi:hypothetical protein